MLVLHANWSDRALRVWAESEQAFAAQFAPDDADAGGWNPPGDSGAAAGASSESGGGTMTAQASPRCQSPTSVNHAFAVDADRLRQQLIEHGLLAPDVVTKAARFDAMLPSLESGSPAPSDRLAAVVDTDHLDEHGDIELRRVSIAALELSVEDAVSAMLALDDVGPSQQVAFDHDLQYIISVCRFVIELISDQRFIPTLVRRPGDVAGAWHPWLHDDQLCDHIEKLVRRMPPIVRAVCNQHEHHPWAILQEALNDLTDALIRSALRADDFADSIASWSGRDDVHVHWLSGLLDGVNVIDATDESVAHLLRGVSGWLDRLDAQPSERLQRVSLCLEEPVIDDDDPMGAGAIWRLGILLQCGEDDVPIPVEQLWAGAAAARLPLTGTVEQAQEHVLGELVRAGRIYSRLEATLAGVSPTAIDLTTAEAVAFLRDARPVLIEAGFDVHAPVWWGASTARLGARLHLSSVNEGPREDEAQDASTVGGESVVLGLDTIVDYQWELAIGEEPISTEQFEALARSQQPLVRLHGRWVELTEQDLEAARTLLEDGNAGQVALRDAFHLAHGATTSNTGLQVQGLHATGWIAELLDASTDSSALRQIGPPEDFLGELRPYQLNGLRWLAMLDRFGLGACLADDMGLGKTIQLIALLLHERRPQVDSGVVGPTLLVVPTSLIANWVREIERFAPNLRVLVHHGPERRFGDAFVSQSQQNDVVITTYGLVSRDRDTLMMQSWHRVALDEAQYIKNPPTKQTAAIRSLSTPRRIALTGTPLENRLSELWSIMEFCNPGHLGQQSLFRKRFAVPIERHREQKRAEQLRELVRPFILRRLKTDPNVIQDLPECVDTREYATLTPEQAALYERTVQSMLRDVDASEGIQRRGLVLATLVKLKQVCNHPAQYLKEEQSFGGANGVKPADFAPSADRSGKSQRLMRMLEEIIAAGEKALVFTQFRQMGRLLAAMIRSELDREALFLHGGTPVKKRQQLIDQFQEDNDECPVFILSLKAGGIGLNLTAANHVFHFDRWWNPAVEKQATDRAFRIGQTKTVHVHKFVCLGTLEERIDQMIEQKTELAQNIIGTGEQWITELSTSQLQELLVLRNGAVEAES